MGSQLGKGGQQANISSRTSTGPQISSPKRRPLTTSTTPANRISTQNDTSSSTSSGVSSSNRSSEDQLKPSSRIVVVNAGPAPNQSSPALVKRLPALIRPLIPLGQVQINPNYPQLQSQPIVNLGLDLEQELRLQAEIIAREQTKLVEKIRDIDQQVTASSVSIGAERQRRFNKAVDNFAKFDEIDQLINRCETDIENILTVFLQLNEALPEALCLEPFALQV